MTFSALAETFVFLKNLRLSLPLWSASQSERAVVAERHVAGALRRVRVVVTTALTRVGSDRPLVRWLVLPERRARARAERLHKSDDERLQFSWVVEDLRDG